VTDESRDPERSNSRLQHAEPNLKNCWIWI